MWCKGRVSCSVRLLMLLSCPLCLLLIFKQLCVTAGRSLNIRAAYVLSAGGRNIGKRWAFRFNSALLRQRVTHIAVWLLMTEGMRKCLTSCSWTGRRSWCRASHRRVSRRCPGGGWNRATPPGTHRQVAPWGRTSTRSGRTVSIRLRPPVWRYGGGGIYRYGTKELFSYDDIISY